MLTKVKRSCSKKSMKPTKYCQTHPPKNNMTFLAHSIPVTTLPLTHNITTTLLPRTRGEPTTNIILNTNTILIEGILIPKCILHGLPTTNSSMSSIGGSKLIIWTGTMKHKGKSSIEDTAHPLRKSTWEGLWRKWLEASKTLRSSREKDSLRLGCRSRDCKGSMSNRKESSRRWGSRCFSRWGIWRRAYGRLTVNSRRRSDYYQGLILLKSLLPSKMQ